MKIYKKAVIDMTTMETLEEDSYCYQGLVAWCKGGGDTDIEETPEEKELAQIAREKWEYYGEQFAPLEAEYMSRVNDYGKPSETRQVVGQAVQGVGSQFDQAANKAATGLISQGIDPSSGKFQGTMSQLAGGQGEAMGKAATSAGLGLERQRLLGLQNLVSLGQGKSTSAQQGLSDVAAQSTQEAINNSLQDTYSDISKSQSNANLAGTGLGIAAGSWLNRSSSQSGSSLGMGAGNQDYEYQYWPSGWGARE